MDRAEQLGPLGCALRQHILCGGKAVSVKLLSGGDVSVVFIYRQLQFNHVLAGHEAAGLGAAGGLSGSRKEVIAESQLAAAGDESVGLDDGGEG